MNLAAHVHDYWAAIENLGLFPAIFYKIRSFGAGSATRQRALLFVANILGSLCGFVRKRYRCIQPDFCRA